MKIITGGKVFYKGSFIEGHTLVYGEKTINIIKDNEVDKSQETEEINLTGEYIFPGFIDVHIHGKGGSDTMDGSYEALCNITATSARAGVTSLLPTTMSMAKTNIYSALENIGEFMTKGNPTGAKVIGAHLEGPFINKEKKGAQPEDGIFPIDEQLILKNKEVIKIISMAPEIDNGIEFIAKYKDDFNFSIAHTGADYDTATKAVKSGAKSFTHLFNAMTGLNHRNPGCVGSALTNECFVEMICDDIHINSNLYTLVKNAKGMDSIMLITDCIRAGGLEDGQYDLGGQQVTVSNGKCTLPGDVIAGSILDYNVGIRNFYNATSVSRQELAKATSINQARYLGLQDTIGEIKEGNFADYAVLDEDFNVIYTIVNGNVVYKR